jgi:hypothetical protein
MPSGRSWRNSKAAVSFSMKTILTYNRNIEIRQRRRKSNLLSAEKNDLASWPDELLMGKVVFVRVKQQGRGVFA